MRTSRLPAYISLAVLVTLVGFPVYWMLLTSFKSRAQLGTTRFMFWPAPFALQNYVNLFTQFHFTQFHFTQWMWNSVVVAVAATLLSTVAGVLGAYGLTRLRFRGRDTLAGAVLVTYLVPPTILFIPLFRVIKDLGLANSLTGLIVAYPTFTVPLAKPGLVAAALFAFTNSWNEFIYALVFNSQAKLHTVTVGLTNLVMGDVYLWGELMAGAVLATLPVVVLYLYLQKYVVAGLTAGAVKG